MASETEPESQAQAQAHPKPEPEPEPESESRAQPIVYTPSTIDALPAESFTPSSSPLAPKSLSWRTLLSSPTTPSDSLTAGLATCPPSSSLALHRHTQAEIYYITSGSGTVIIEGQEHRVETGSVLFIPGDAEHGVWTGEGEVLEWFYVFPAGGFGEVFYRFSENTKERAG